ncbi:hypothetical protein bthur0013_27820 [Bacillus thuringiensis IBL 200]|nr:hypothetical protein bthur0013_27820 [Bacillus thuringiensis IBL 200]
MIQNTYKFTLVIENNKKKVFKIESFSLTVQVLKNSAYNIKCFPFFI